MLIDLPTGCGGNVTVSYLGVIPWGFVTFGHVGIQTKISHIGLEKDKINLFFSVLSFESLSGNPMLKLTGRK